MTFVSYARNFEDVLLWRALKEVAAGFYIDVGAASPDVGSATRAFHDRGWRGVNVAPSPAAFARLAAARPRDVNLACAVAAGEAALPGVPGTGLAPARQERAAATVPVRTLAGICREHAAGPVHFLKVDAAGAERTALEGADFAACRPWIVLVAAAEPMPTGLAHAAWEPLLLAAGYRFAWFDGLNRFYVAEERHAALAPAFTAPPNVFDDFVRAADSDLAQRLAEAEGALALARAEVAVGAARAQGSAWRLLDAFRATGAARGLDAERADALGWLRGLLAESQELARQLREESPWLRAQVEEQRRLVDERTGQLMARADESAWLRECLSASEAALAATAGQRDRLHQLMEAAEARATAEQARAWAEHARAGAVERAAQAQLEAADLAYATLQASLSWRVTAPLRRVRKALSTRPPPPQPALLGPASPEPAPPPGPLQPGPLQPGPLQPGPAEPALVQPTPLQPEPVQPEPVQPEPVQPEPVLPPPVQPAPSVPPPEPAPPEPAPEPPPPAQQAAPAPAAAASPILPATLRPVHAVHQFHSGSAVGDAITNAMLMLRAALRAMGYDSEIYVWDRDDALAGELRTLDALPRHDGYVLLAHYSMGYGAFDQVIALPARKVLVYHNITPPEFLAHIPRVQANARLGREQLATWRRHAVAALADSEYNAIELRSLGFHAARACALLFDAAALRQHAATAQAARDPATFTMLFVGRFTPSKAQDDLIAAYARFSARAAKPSRLVLVGAFDADQSDYLDRLNAMVLANGLADHVLMTGLLPDEELHAWYARADLYVSLSHHEGFGVPLVEAMAHGLPVLAWPAGAIPYTLGGAAALLADRAPEAVAERMLALAGDPAQRAAIAARQSASLDRFALPAQLPLLRDALALAGAQPRPSAAARQALAANVRLAVAGHVNKSYSLAAVNRSIAAAFEAQRPGSVRLIPVEGQPTGDLSEVPPEALPLVAALAARGPPSTGPEVTLSQHYPVFVPAERGDLALAMLFWEESLLPAATVRALNAGFDGVLAPSRFVAKLLVDSGVHVPVLNVGLAPPLAEFASIDERPARRPFTFLHVSSAFPRKGVDALLAAWRLAFRAGDPVRLVVKAFPNPHNDAAAQVAHLRAEDPGAAPVTLIDRDLDFAAQRALFAEADAMALPSRGEGYNLAAAEAMAAGLPLVVTDGGGHRDFCGPGTARLVRSRSAPSGSHLAPPHSLWLEPDVDDLAAALREVAKGVPAGQVEAARVAIAAHADPGAFVDRFADAAAALILAGPPPPARIAWVSSWGVRCGVAEYSRALVEAMPRERVARLAVLCDDRAEGDGDAVRACWALGAERGVDRLLDAVRSEDADVVVVQHQPGLLPWDRLAEVLAALAAEGRATLATLHNTQHLLEAPAGERQAVVAALGGAARILVHTQADLVRLGELGLQDRLTLLPHGAPAALPARPARPLPPGSDPVVGCYGFFLPGKGIGALVEAVAALRARWPGIRLRLVNAEYGHGSSAAEIAACRAAAEALGLAVEWHLGFLPDAASAALLAGCDLVALPYEPSREASSAAVRSALASGAPVAVTPIALFEEAEGAVARLPGGSPAALAEGVAALLDDADRRAALGEAAQSWLAARAVPDVARRLHGLMLGLAAQRHVGAPFDGSRWPGGWTAG